MAHRHNFKRNVQVTWECNCGADGQACEGCGHLLDIMDMRSDSEDVWLCPRCFRSMVAEAKRERGR